MAEPKNYRRHVYATVLTALFAAIIAVCSFVTVPGPVPFTLQTFGVFLALMTLGGAGGSAAVLLYILIGALGLPVFSGFRGGIGALLGPTGGYIVGFLLCAVLYWIFEGKLKDIVLLIIGNLVCYLFGTVWFVYVYSSGGKAITFGAALMLCVVPYLLPDAIKMLLAFVLSRRVKKLIP
jgi:biotin transport system substrate-specific component